MGHGLETMALTASHTIEGDRAVLLPVTEGEGPTHSDSQANTPHTCVCTGSGLRTSDDTETQAGSRSPGLPFSVSHLAQPHGVPATHVDAVGDHSAVCTVLLDTEVVQALGECGPMVINVSKVDGYQGDGGVPTD